MSFNRVLVASFIILASLAGAISIGGGSVSAAGGATWTTTGICGTPQDSNFYEIGDVVYINGSGFDPSTAYAWSITGGPGGSSADPGIVVASGTITPDSAGNFCFGAYTVLPDDDGEYKTKVGTKGDNYRVDGLTGGGDPPPPPPPPPPLPGSANLTVVKLMINDDGGTATSSDFTLHVKLTGIDVLGSPFSGSASGTMSSLSPETYVVSEDTLSGYQLMGITGDCASDGTVILADGDSKLCTLTNDDEPGEIHGSKFEDQDADGIWDGGEPGLGSWIINLYDSSMVWVASTTTAVDGSYAFTDLAAGTYSLTEEMQVGWIQTASSSAPIMLDNGEVVSDINFGNHRAGRLTVIKLVINDNGGTATSSDFAMHVKQGSTDVTGSPFPGSIGGTSMWLASSTYMVSEDANPDYAATESGDCASDGTVLVTSASDRTCTLTNNDIPAEIHGQKFGDDNANGLKDSGEIGLSGWVINLYDGSMVLLATTTTDSSGNYWFMDLDVGTYNVRETGKSGWTQTTADPAAFILGLGDVVTGVNFGNFKLSTISGYKWRDVNGNGIQDSGDGKLAGWTIFIDANSNMTLDPGEISTTTTSGGYTLLGLWPGTYSVCEVMMSGWRAATAGCRTVVISAGGMDITGVNYGNIGDGEGTQGFWRNWSKHKKYTSTQINGWLVTIDTTSKWLMPAGYSANTTGMVKLIDDSTKQCNLNISSLTCAKLKFYTQYMVTRLDHGSGKKNSLTWYAVTPAAQTLLGLDPMERLGDIVAAVEAWTDSGLRSDYLTLAGQFDQINNTGF